MSIIQHKERKMKCKICDQLLSDYEATKKDTETREYLDTCSYCISMSKPNVVDFVENENKFIKSIIKD